MGEKDRARRSAEMQRKLEALRSDIKVFERSFRSSFGLKPTAADIGERPEISSLSPPPFRLSSLPVFLSVSLVSLCLCVSVSLCVARLLFAR